MNVAIGQYAKVKYYSLGGIIDDIVRVDAKLSPTMLKGKIIVGERIKSHCYFSTDEVQFNFGYVTDFKEQYPEYFI